MEQSSPFFFGIGVTEATLNRDGNVPSVNDNVARRAINGANRSTDYPGQFWSFVHCCRWDLRKTGFQTIVSSVKVKKYIFTGIFVANSRHWTVRQNFVCNRVVYIWNRHHASDCHFDTFKSFESFLATVHVHNSEQDVISKHDIKTQPSLFKTVQLSEITYFSVGHIVQSDKALREPSFNRF